MRDLFDAVAKASGCKRVKTILPASLAMAMAAVAELVAGLVRKPTIRTRFTIYNLVRINDFSSEKVARELD